MGLKLDIEDNSDMIKNATKEAIERALYAIGLQWLKNVTYIMTSRFGSITRGGAGIVDTGRARGSMAFMTEGLTQRSQSAVSENKGSDYISGGSGAYNRLVVGSNLDYIQYIVTGTYKMAARDFMTPSIIEFSDEYKQLAEAALKGEV